MNIQETRQLGIEFERRVQTMIPQKEFLDKLDTETIYSFLNQYQDKYIAEMQKSVAEAQSGSVVLNKIDNILQPLLVNKVYAKTERVSPPADGLDLGRSISYNMPDDYAYYVKSTSEVSSVYRYKNNTLSNRQDIKIVPNKFVSQKDLAAVIESPFDSFRILRVPIATVNNKENNILSILYDSYTTIERVTLTYYKRPNHFTILTSTPCELPMDAFDDLVTGAVALYVLYVTGGKLGQDDKKKQENKDE